MATGLVIGSPSAFVGEGYVGATDADTTLALAPYPGMYPLARRR